jgi:antitoxin component of MazEF toxin-antitoxin module
MSLQSTVGIARTGAKSLRATIPEGMVAFLQLNEGDKLDWHMEIQNNRRVAIVSKVETQPEPVGVRERTKRKH